MKEKETGEELWKKLNEISNKCAKHWQQRCLETNYTLSTEETKACYNDYENYRLYVMERGQNIEEPLAYLALGYAFSLVNSDSRKQAIFYLEKYFENPQPSEQCVPSNILYGIIAEAYEKEYNFMKAIEYLTLQENEENKTFPKPPKAIYEKNSSGIKIKSLVYKNADCEKLVTPNGHIGSLYLKLNPQLAIDYWNKQKENPFYEEDSFYKNEVDYFMSEALYKQAKGYIYKPKEKDNQLKFQENNLANTTYLL